MPGLIRQLVEKSQEALQRRADVVAFVGGATCAMLIFAIDLALPDEVRLHALYVFPLAIVARYCPRLSWSIALLALATGLQIAAFSLQTVTTPSLVSDVAVPFATSLLTLFLARAWRSSYLTVAQQAALDPLTGLANRRVFMTNLNAEISRQKRSRSTFSLALLDLDGFKALNDSKGHRAGDEALKLVAEVLRNHTRSSDSLGRIGGDEFGILMPDTEAAPGTMLRELCERIAITTAAADCPVTSSIGCRTFRLPPASAIDALQDADRVMYAAKVQGKNRAEYLSDVPPRGRRGAGIGASAGPN